MTCESLTLVLFIVSADIYVEGFTGANGSELMRQLTLGRLEWEFSSYSLINNGLIEWNGMHGR